MSCRARRISLGILAFLIAAFGEDLFSGPSVVAEEPSFGIIVRIRGEAQYQKAGSSKWGVPTERMRFNPGDSIRTGKNGSVVVKLSKGNVVAIQEDSVFTLEKAQARIVITGKTYFFGLFGGKKSETEYDYQAHLGEGVALSSLKGLKGQSTFSLGTPVAVAGVRGTVFGARVIPPEKRKLAFLGDRIDEGKGGPDDGGYEATFAVHEGSVEVEGHSTDFDGTRIITEDDPPFTVTGMPLDEGGGEAADEPEEPSAEASEEAAEGEEAVTGEGGSEEEGTGEAKGEAAAPEEGGEGAFEEGAGGTGEVIEGGESFEFGGDFNFDDFVEEAEQVDEVYETVPDDADFTDGNDAIDESGGEESESEGGGDGGETPP